MKRVRANRRKQPKREWVRVPRLPRIPVNWRRVFAVTATAGMLALSVPVATEVIDWPVRQLEIEGQFQRVTRQDIVAAVRPTLNRSLFRLDFGDIRERVAAITWVDTVRLQRVWPDTLRITYSEHRATARWGDSGLLNTRGELFVEDASGEYEELPRLDGPPGSHRRVIDRYLDVREHLARTTLRLEAIHMDARGAFTIELFGGPTVRIGRDDVDERVERFFDVAAPYLLQVQELNQADYIDMRYPSGFAVGWREPVSSRTELVRLESGG
jgi:cell division protein FtsQ